MQKYEQKKIEKTFMEELKTIQPKTTLHLPTLPSFIQDKFAQQHDTNNTVATQTFDDDQTPAISWINIPKTYMT